jgi:diadenosine tetraphosphate (Ap4A) HIT family hydrolase
MAFSLHPNLAADTFFLAELELSDVLLMNDQRFPWCILVPRLTGLRELHDVPAESKPVFWREIDDVANALQKHSNAHKMNVAALGNMVPQLHVHVIARQIDDPAWPGPVWGVGVAQAYDDAQANREITALRELL